jgi:nucleosome binding factor SPN SPT16 subunit
MPGAEFRDPTLLLSGKATAAFRARMYFNLVVGFQGVPLTAADRKKAKKGAAVAGLETFSLLLADTVKIPEAAAAALDEKLATKYDYQLGKVMWEIGEEGEEGDDKDDEAGADGGGDDARDRPSSTRATANILSSRLRERKRDGDDGLTQGQIDKQMKALLERKMRERAEKAQTTGRKKDDGDDGEVEDLTAYRCVGCRLCVLRVETVGCGGGGGGGEWEWEMDARLSLPLDCCSDGNVFRHHHPTNP